LANELLRQSIRISWLFPVKAQTMWLLTALCFGLAAAATWTAPARAQEFDAWLKLYAVHIYRTGQEKVSGTGVYLGHGVVLTAGHVAGLGIWRRPRVEIAGKILPTGILRDGHFHRVDLELLSVDEHELPVSLALRRMPLCRAPLPPGAPVIVATPDNVVRSVVLPPRLLPRNVQADYSTMIAYVEESGASGSGVFDANTKCLAGIITRQVTRTVQTNGQAASEQPIAKYFIPASDIADFVPKSVRF
jgi:hypothetical protein